MLFDALVFGEIRTHPFRAILTVVAIAVAVGITLAVVLATATTAGAFAFESDSLDKHVNLQVFGIGQTLDERALARIRYLPGVEAAYPVLDGNVGVTGGRLGPEILRVRGVDLLKPLPGVSGIPHREPSTFSRSGSLASAELAMAGDGVILTADFANRHGLKSGNDLHVQVNDRPSVLRVAAVLPASEVGAESDTAFVDIATAQTLFQHFFVLDRIDVVTSDDINGVRARIARLLPAGGRVVAPDDSRDAVGRLFEYLEQDLFLLCAVALLIAIVVVYEGIGTSIERRSSDIAILRSLGATKSQIFRTFLLEGTIFGFFGSTLGYALGVAFAKAMISVVAVQMVEPRHVRVELDGFVVLSVFAIGTALAALSAGAAAVAAMRIRPAAAMAARGTELQGDPARPVRRLVTVLSIFAASVIAPELSAGRWPNLGYVCVAALVFVCALCVSPALRGISLLGAARYGAASSLAQVTLASFRRLPRRVGIAITSLAISTSAVVAVTIVGESFHFALNEWVNQSFLGDLAIVPAQSARLGDGIFTPTVGRRAARVPGVARVNGVRALELSLRGETIKLRGEDALNREQLGKSRDSSIGVSMSRRLARRLGLRLGDVFPMPSPTGSVELRLRSWRTSAPEGVETISGPRQLIVQRYRDDRVDSFYVFTNPTANLLEVRSTLIRILGSLPAVVSTTLELRQQAVGVVDEMNGLVEAVAMICLLMAAISMSTSGAAFILERRRDFALIRYLGATCGDVRRIAVLETFIRSTVGTGLGVILGLLVGTIQLELANSAGQAIGLHVSVGAVLLIGAFLVAAALGSAILPAREVGFIDASFARGAE